jgi:hypothetical protein
LDFIKKCTIKFSLIHEEITARVMFCNFVTQFEYCFSVFFQVASDDELMTHALVGSVRAENSSENSSSVLKVGTRVNSITSFLLPEHSK